MSEARARRQQPAHVRRIHLAEIGHVGGRLADQSDQPGLAVGPPDGLGQGGGRHRDAGCCFTGAGQQHHHAAVIPVQGYQAAAHPKSRPASGRRLGRAAEHSHRPRPARRQDSGPPVYRKSSAGIAPPSRNVVQGNRHGVLQRSRMRSARSGPAPGPGSGRAGPSSSVPVTFRVAIPVTIPLAQASQPQRSVPGTSHHMPTVNKSGPVDRLTIEATIQL